MEKYRFIEEAQNARKNPPSSAWEKIESQLDHSQATKVSPLRRWVPVAAAMLVAFAIGGTILSKNIQSETYIVSNLEDIQIESIYMVDNMSQVRAAYKAIGQ